MSTPSPAPDGSNPLNTHDGWDQRYSSDAGLGVPGTFTHSDRGNGQFYRTKFRALDRCLAHTGGLQGKTVFDAAGGSGQFVEYFLARGARRVALADFSHVALRLASERFRDDSRVSTQVLDMSDDNYHAAERHDLVVVMEAIFLLPSDEQFARALHNLATTVAPRGCLIISDVFPTRTLRQSPYVVRRSREHFERLLSAEGLKVLTYVPQTFVFNRRLFGGFQPRVERWGALLFWLDQLALILGLRPPAETPSDVKYLIARRG